MIPVRMLQCLLAAALCVPTLPVNAAVSCSVSTTGAMNFMTYDPLSAANATVTVTLNCLNNPPPGGVTVNWAMQLTNGSSGICVGATGRTMQRQPALDATIGYNIYQNATSIVWGNAGCGTFPSGSFTINGNNSFAVNQTMTGVAPSGQFVPAGTYSETLQLTVSF
ncbi:MAG TPA: spore coat protein U domain-containing protein [Burkholderiaceae bacterium]|nr:spore coat protein U domain-containing protein [Burkholderiaceae bacterium]